MCIGELAQCTDPVPDTTVSGEELKLDATAQSIRSTYDAKGLRINPHILLNPGETTPGTRHRRNLKRFNEALVNAGGVELYRAGLGRSTDSDVRFEPIDIAQLPLASVGYFQLFGHADNSRSVADLAHARVDSTNKRIEVSDALRGAACGFVQSGSSLGDLTGNFYTWHDGAFDYVLPGPAGAMMPYFDLERSDHVPSEMFGREKLMPTRGNATNLNKADHMRSNLVLRVACGVSNPTITEFAILCYKAASIGSDGPAIILDSLRRTVDRNAFKGVPPCVQALRRAGLVELGHMFPVLPEKTTKMPQMEAVKGAKSGPERQAALRASYQEFAKVAKSGVTERALSKKHGVGLRRVDLPETAAEMTPEMINSMVDQLWDAGLYQRASIFYGFVPMTTDFECPGVDDVLLSGGTATALANLATLERVLGHATEYSVKMMTAIETHANNKTAFKDAARIIVQEALTTDGRLTMVPVVRTHYNALLPASVTRAGLHEYDTHW